jgi:hypothetical protein
MTRDEALVMMRNGSVMEHMDGDGVAVRFRMDSNGSFASKNPGEIWRRYPAEFLLLPTFDSGWLEIPTRRKEVSVPVYYVKRSGVCSVFEDLTAAMSVAEMHSPPAEVLEATLTYKVDEYE